MSSSRRHPLLWLASLVRARLGTCRLTVATVAIIALSGTLRASHPRNGQPENTSPLATTRHDFSVKDFRFASGETLSEIGLHYQTAGIAVRDAAGRISNAVLVLHGSSGDASQVLASSFSQPLFGAGGPLDAARHFLIFPDSLGNGRSSKPSDGLRARFPKYGYADMVALQHRLVTAGLGITQLRAIIGISMGGMHAWMWGARHPESMRALLPIAAQPTPIQGRNLLWRRILTQAIRNDPQWDGGNYTAPPQGFLSIMPMFDMLVQSPVRLAAAVRSSPDADTHLAAVRDEILEEDDASNILYRFEASHDYDIVNELGRIRAPLLNIMFADDELNPPEGSEMQPAMARVKTGRLVVIPAGRETEGHRTQVKASVWREHVRQFLRNVP